MKRLLLAVLLSSCAARVEQGPTAGDECHECSPTTIGLTCCVSGEMGVCNRDYRCAQCKSTGDCEYLVP